jgi:hypothetical protein
LVGILFPFWYIVPIEIWQHWVSPISIYIACQQFQFILGHSSDRKKYDQWRRRICPPSRLLIW